MVVVMIRYGSYFRMGNQTYFPFHGGEIQDWDNGGMRRISEMTKTSTYSPKRAGFLMLKRVGDDGLSGSIGGTVLSRDEEEFWEAFWRLKRLESMATRMKLQMQARAKIVGGGTRSCSNVGDRVGIVEHCLRLRCCNFLPQLLVNISISEGPPNGKCVSLFQDVGSVNC
jgi:hypothetical protein